MIIVKLRGALGNQLFEYAAGRALAVRHQAELRFDCSTYEESVSTEYSLGNFRISGHPATAADIQRLRFRRTTLPERLARRLLRRSPRAPARTYFSERECRVFDSDLLNQGPDAYLNGFWQSEKYFLDIADLIRAEIVPSVPLSGATEAMCATIQSCNSVSLHVRRGNYRNKMFVNSFGLTPLEHYHRAVAYMNERVSDAHFFLFTDEPDYVTANLHLDSPCTLVSGDTTEYEDLWLMRNCRHHITANSTFSWWGAWLNPSPDKIVVVPEKWFADGRPKYDLIPETWHTL